MGQIALVAGSDIARSVLGSCIGLVIHDPVRKAEALAHIVLPQSNGPTDTPGKFVDTAVAHILDRMQAEGTKARSLVAKMIGGSNMFTSKGPFKVGQQNIAAVQQALRERGIRLVAEHVGGKSGRRVTFRPANGSVEIEVAGEATVIV